MSRYRFIDQHRALAPVRELCTVLQVAPSSYYAWRKHRQQPAPAWERAVVRAFQHHARRMLRAHGLHAQQPRSFVPRTTDSAHGQRVAPNRLLRQPRPTAPNQVWVGAITGLPKPGGGWVYLASWQDARSRKVVGFGAAPAALRTCAKPCPRTWSAKPCAGPWPCAIRWPA